jgi:cell division protein FtsQ
MIKTVLLIVSALFLTTYLAFAVIFLNPKVSVEEKCVDLQVEVIRTSDISYLNEVQVKLSLQRANLNPVGKSRSAIDIESIEKNLKENKLIKKVEAYKAIDGTVRIKVYQRTPVLRVIAGKNYYIDSEGEVMPVPANFAAYLPLATGNISEEYAKKQLYPFVLFLQKNKFWNLQIEQIHIAPNLDVELIPRVGNHQIILGKIEHYEENLAKLKLFYEKGLNKIGWNRYSIINLKFKNQVVCTKRE